jgi:PTH1 family peptidyl-tRNA hydrolase
MSADSVEGSAPSGLRLVAGLGNPGAKYVRTRHNIGFQVVDRMAAAGGIEIRREKFDVVFGRGKIEGLDVLLAKPMAFMNRSGPPLRSLRDFFQVADENLLVIHDDIDLDFGRLKIKSKGGHGGHNGIRSIMEAFGGGDFARLRIGVGRSADTDRASVSNYVLDSFQPEEAERLPEIIDRARDAAVTILCRGLKTGMNRFNVRDSLRMD